MTDETGIKFKFESHGVSFEHGHIHSFTVSCWGHLGTAMAKWKKGSFCAQVGLGDCCETGPAAWH